MLVRANDIDAFLQSQETFRSEIEEELCRGLDFSTRQQEGV
jgi:hypothetical protein